MKKNVKHKMKLLEKGYQNRMKSYIQQTDGQGNLNIFMRLLIQKHMQPFGIHLQMSF